MSSTDEGAAPTDAVDYGSIAERAPQLSRTLSNDFDVQSGQEPSAERHDTAQEEAATATMTSPDGRARDTPLTAANVMGPNHAAGEQHDDDDTNARASIERQASEHLARRATEMSLSGDDDDEQPHGRNPDRTAITTKHDLPQTPPPPPPAPPRKNSDAAKQPARELEYDEKHPPATSDDSQLEVPEALSGTTEVAGTEIQNIMDQFESGMGGLEEQAIMSPRLERQQPMLVLPPRSSSLEPQPSYTLSPQTSGQSVVSPIPLKAQGTGTSIASSIHGAGADDTASITSARAGTLFQPPPPSPEPEAALPFDFHRFLEQLRNKSADPVARYLRSFLGEFGKRQWMVHEQVKIISDFLEFISRKMAQCEVWRTVSDAEFDNAREGMEKLVMNRLYSFTFSPAIPSPPSSPRKNGRSNRMQADQANLHGPGRRGQHQEDVERDEVIAQKIKIYGWIREDHLDVKPLGTKGDKFLTLAQKELLKINSYRAPRDKVICVLNCCKVIFGFLKNAKQDQSADAFVPLLIYTVLRARPENLVSNVQYIWRFRNQDKLGGEAGYYMSSLMGVVTFIENLDRTNLTISDEDFEQNVERAVSAIAEKNRADEQEAKFSVQRATGPMGHLNEKSTLSRPEVTPRNSMEVEQSTPRRSHSQRLNEKLVQPSGSGSNEDEGSDAMTGLLRSIQKPLSSIGRIFSDDGNAPGNTPRSASTPRRLSPAPPLERGQGTSRSNLVAEDHRSQRRPSGDDASARQASAEVAQTQAVRVREHKVVVETLQSMFPNLDREVIEDVVRAQEGNVGRAVDACLALSG
ncbi:Putative vacuolar protein sorting-associated protein [Septoria linicola]|uniref:Vacuolar protein sorting-associated protein n=1 Tax=Septoria linicola TaxID=215465 RepID=A0A9Q9AJM1_9PEZI|nr:putative vacuolar protein sorting-associated protein [Septoria linicola]USW47650.1 Putative vacuolar protein sorting-associated protein [Septoria linicola]